MTPPASDTQRGWRRIAVVAWVALAAMTLGNTCAVDDLEARLAQLQAGRSEPVVAPLAVAVPGSATGYRARGFGGAEADVIHVEGAAPDAPLQVHDKPHPQGGTLQLRDPSAPRSLGPFVTDVAGYRVLQRVLGRLLVLDPDHPQVALPSLATAYTVSDDGRRTTWHIRRGVQFADGREMTAADVVWSFDVLRDPAVDAGYLRGRFENVVSVEAVDDYTVAVEVAEASWRDALAFGHELRVLHRQWFTEVLPRVAAANGLPATGWSRPGDPGFGEAMNLMRVPGPGTGPYMLDTQELDTRDGVTLVRNPFAMDTQLWPDNHNVDRVRFVYVADDHAALERLKAGEIDILPVDHATWDDALSRDATVTAVADRVEFDALYTFASAIVWNHRRPPLDDARVRRALAGLVDREWLLREVDRGRGAVALGPSKPGFAEYPHDLPPIPFDPAEAANLLAAAGWVDTDADGVRDRDGRPLRIELMWAGSRPFYRQLFASVRDAAARCGVDIVAAERDGGTFSARFAARDFDAAAQVGITPDPWIDPIGWYHSRQDVPGGMNASGWRDPVADGLMERIHTTFDVPQRLAAWREFHARFREEQPVTLLLHGKTGLLVSRRLRGARTAAIGFVDAGVWIP